MTVDDRVHDAEYADRLRRVQEAMARKTFGALVVCDPANLFYLTGYNAWSFYTPQCLLVPAEGTAPVRPGAGRGGRGVHLQPARRSDPRLPGGAGAPAGRAPVRLDRRHDPHARACR